MNDIGNKTINANLNEDFGNLNLKLKTICKASSNDVDILINNLHDFDEKLNRNVINDCYSSDNYMIQPLLTELNSNNNNNNNNNSLINVPSNRYVNCSDWSEGINSWQHIHPYSYYVNYVNLINRKRSNRKYEIEFDEPLGLFVPHKVENSSANDNYQPRPQNPINCTTTTAPGYMREITRTNLGNSNQNKVFHSNVIYDKSFLNITNIIAKRASSAHNNNTNMNIDNNSQNKIPITQRPPNNSLDISNNTNNNDNKHQQSIVTSIAQPHIYNDHKTITNHLSKQQQHIINSLTTNSVYKLTINTDNETQTQLKSAQKPSQPIQREKSSLSDFENRNKSNCNAQDKIDKIRKTFNAIVNKSQPRGEFLIAPRSMLEEIGSNEDYRKDQLPTQIQVVKNPNLVRLDSDLQNQLSINNYYKQPINQAEAQINSKTSSGISSYTTSHGLALDGESLMNTEKNLDYLMFAKRKQETENNGNNFDNMNYRSKKAQSIKSRNVSTATTNTSNLTATTTTTQTLNTISDLSNYASSQFHESPLLPPIISGKRINLPHGPHR
jgi:hypothetical protein